MTPKKEGPTQEEAFHQLKKELTQPTVLAVYDPDADTKICSDASSYGLGAVLLQRQAENQWKPISYASRAMSETEQRYSQIEKEALAIIWACEKFSHYMSSPAIVRQCHEWRYPGRSTVLVVRCSRVNTGWPRFMGNGFFR